MDKRITYELKHDLKPPCSSELQLSLDANNLYQTQLMLLVIRRMSDSLYLRYAHMFLELILRIK